MSDYRMEHTSPGPDSGQPLHDIHSSRGGYFGPDVHDHPENYGVDHTHPEARDAARRVKGRPGAFVTVYRALPHGHTTIHQGDWVSTSGEYARQHGMHHEDPDQDMPVIKAKVPAHHVYTEGDLMDLGYHGPDVEAEVHHSGGKHAASRHPFVGSASLSFDYSEQETGGSKYPTKSKLTAVHPEHGPVGSLTYWPPRRSNGKLKIDRLEVEQEHRRQGHGSALMNELQRRHPKSSIDHGDRTNDGKAWWAGYGQGADSKGRTASFTPTQRIFGPTYGLDRRLFDGEHLKQDVTSYVLGTLGAFWEPRYGPTWRVWARVYLAGSEASEWTSAALEGNNDFDVLIGVHYDRCRESVPALSQLSDLEITDRFNAEFRASWMPHTSGEHPVTITIDGKSEGPFDQTVYVNPDSYDIRDIKPYAAYDITRHAWAVKPPHLPDWSIEDFPQGHALVEQAHGYETVIRAILAMPEPYRSQQGDALWRHLHGDRSRAFGPQGEGWYDSGNVLEKWLDQAGLWEQLAQVHFDAVADPNRLLAPADWSNDPRVPA